MNSPLVLLREDLADGFDAEFGEFQGSPGLVPGFPLAAGVGQFDAEFLQGRSLGIDDRLGVQGHPLGLFGLRGLG